MVKKSVNNKPPVFFKVIIFSICLLLVALIISYLRRSSALKPSDIDSMPKIRGWLKTKGADIYDESGKKVYLRGVNYSELTPSDYVYRIPDLTGLPEICRRWPYPPTKLDAKKVYEMGFNVVRLVVNWDTLEVTPPIQNANGSWKHNWNMTYVQAIDNAVADLKKYQIAVILDLHQYLWSSAFKYIESEDGSGCSGSGIPAWLYPQPTDITFQIARCDFFKDKKQADTNISPQEGFIEAWKFLVDRYKKDKTVVAIDIINEPWIVKNKCTAKDLNLNNFYEKVGSEVRKINPKLLLIYEDSQDFPDFDLALSGPLSLSNSVYSIHLYSSDWESSGRQRMDRFLDRARLWQVPLFVGEFNAFGWSGSGPYEEDVTDKLRKEVSDTLKYFKDKGIHWTFWSYSGQDSLFDIKDNSPKKELIEILRKGF